MDWMALLQAAALLVLGAAISLGTARLTLVWQDKRRASDRAADGSRRRHDLGKPIALETIDLFTRAMSGLDSTSWPNPEQARLLAKVSFKLKLIPEPDLARACVMAIVWLQRPPPTLDEQFRWDFRTTLAVGVIDVLSAYAREDPWDSSAELLSLTVSEAKKLPRQPEELGEPG